jgi:hypothetical protein
MRSRSHNAAMASLQLNLFASTAEPIDDPDGQQSAASTEINKSEALTVPPACDLKMIEPTALKPPVLENKSSPEAAKTAPANPRPALSIIEPTAVQKAAAVAPIYSSIWADPRVQERLVELLQSPGETGSTIAAKLNMEFRPKKLVTRSAVIGKSNRINLLLPHKRSERAGRTQVMEDGTVVRLPKKPRGDRMIKLRPKSDGAPKIVAAPRPPQSAIHAFNAAYEKWCEELNERAVDPSNLVEIAKNVPFVPPEELREIETISFDMNPPVPYHMMKGCGCKYVIGPMGGETMACGNERMTANGRFSSPYCSFHARLCTQPTTPKPIRPPADDWVVKKRQALNF